MRKRHSLLREKQECCLHLPYCSRNKTVWLSQEMRHSFVPHHVAKPWARSFTDEKTEAQTEVLRLNLKLKLWDPSALKCGVLRMPEQWEGVHANLGLGTTLSAMGVND